MEHVDPATLRKVVNGGALTVDLEDEILKAAVVTHGGAVVHEGVKG
jgi:NAD(P) transhydrogenase subunit alpha